MSGEGNSTRLIEGFVERSKVRYMGYRYAMLGALSQALRGFESTGRIDDVKLAAVLKQIIEAGVDTESSVVTRSTELVLAGDPESSPIPFAEDVRHTVSLIGDQLRRDARRIASYYRAVALTSMQYLSNAGMTLDAAIKKAEELRQNDLQFRYLDAAGRWWNSEWYLEVVVRSHFFQLLNKARLERMRNDGTYEAAVYAHQSQKHGETIKLPLLEKVRQRIFHPNSRAIVTPTLRVR